MLAIGSKGVSYACLRYYSILCVGPNLQCSIFSFRNINEIYVNIQYTKSELTVENSSLSLHVLIYLEYVFFKINLNHMLTPSVQEMKIKIHFENCKQPRCLIFLTLI